MTRTENGDQATANTSTPSNAKGAHVMPLQIDLRDWFAGQALAGMCALPIEVGATRDFDAAVKEGLRSHAECAYRFADAMLKAREKSDG